MVFLTNWINNYQLKLMETPLSDGNNNKEDKDFSNQAESCLKQSKTLKRRDTLLV